MPQIAIVIINWNGKKDTLNCLASLNKLVTSGFTKSVIVVDNGSSDGVVEEIRKNFPDVHIIETKENLGFTGGNNFGMSYALQSGHNYIWLLNNDTIVDAHALISLIKVFDDPRVGIAGSKIYFAPGREYHKDQYKTSERGHILWYAGGIIDWDNIYARHRGVDEVDRGQYDKTEETAFVTGCSMMIKKEVMQKVGMFDNRYYLYLEDVDLCLRAKRNHYKTVYVPSSKIWHVNAGSSGGPGSKLHQYYLTRNRLLLGMRFAPLRTKVALLREALRFFTHGTPTEKKAVVDFFLGRLGKGIL